MPTPRCAAKQQRTQATSRQQFPARSPIPYTVYSTPQSPVSFSTVLRPPATRTPRRRTAATSRCHRQIAIVANMRHPRPHQPERRASDSTSPSPVVPRATIPTMRPESARSTAAPTTMRSRPSTLLVRHGTPLRRQNPPVPLTAASHEIKPANRTEPSPSTAPSVFQQ